MLAHARPSFSLLSCSYARLTLLLLLIPDIGETTGGNQADEKDVSDKKLAKALEDVDKAKHDIADQGHEAGDEVGRQVEGGREGVRHGGYDGGEHLVDGLEEIVDCGGDGHDCGGWMR